MDIDINDEKPNGYRCEYTLPDPYPINLHPYDQQKNFTNVTFISLTIVYFNRESNRVCILCFV